MTTLTNWLLKFKLLAITPVAIGAAIHIESIELEWFGDKESFPTVIEAESLSHKEDFRGM